MEHKMEIKKGDTVVILTGGSEKVKIKGQKGKVLAVIPDENRVIIENLNLVKRHTKPRSAQQAGGIVEKPRPIDVSNVMLICPSCGKPTRIGHSLGEDGKKYVRQCKKCKEVIDKKASKTSAKAAAKKAAAKKTAKPAAKTSAAEPAAE